MSYLCKFDGAGKRIATVVSGVHFNTKDEKTAYIKDGYIETSDEDYEFYAGNKGYGANGTGYVRGADGKPTDAPAYESTVNEQIATLDAAYDREKTELANYFLEATINGDTELQAELKAEIDQLNADYDEKRRELEGE